MSDPQEKSQLEIYEDCLNSGEHGAGATVAGIHRTCAVKLSVAGARDMDDEHKKDLHFYSPRHYSRLGLSVSPTYTGPKTKTVDGVVYAYVPSDDPASESGWEWVWSSEGLPLPVEGEDGAPEPGTSPQDAAAYATSIINAFPEIPGLLPTAGAAATQLAEIGLEWGALGSDLGAAVDLKTLIEGVFARGKGHAEVAAMVWTMTGIDISPAATGPRGPSRDDISASVMAQTLLAGHDDLAAKTDLSTLTALVHGANADEVAARIWNSFKVNVSEFRGIGTRTEDAKAATAAVLNAHPELLTDYGDVTLGSLTDAIQAALDRGEGSTGIRDAVSAASGGRIDIYEAAPDLHTIALDDQDFQVGTETALNYALTQADLVDIEFEGVTYKIPTRDALVWLQNDRNFSQMSLYEQTSLADAMVRHNTMSAADVGNLATRNAELAESVRSSMAAEGQRAWEFGQQFPETVRQFDVTQAGLESRFARQLLEDQRQADIQAATQQFGQLTGLIPQFGQLALQQTQQQADILRNPADVGWGMATARGETPWWPQTTQADLLNQSAQQFADIQAFLADQAAGIYPPGAAAPGTLPGFQFDPAYHKAKQDEANWNAYVLKKQAYDKAVKDLQEQYGGTAASLYTAADLEAEGLNRGWQGFTGFDMPADRAAEFAPVTLGLSDPWAEHLGNLYADWKDPLTTAAEDNPFRQWNPAWGDFRPYDESSPIEADHTEADALAAEIAALEVPVLPTEFGAQTRGTQALITGDSSFGRPNPELVLNPTGAPLKVIPMNQMSPRQARLVQFGRLPRAEHGFPHTEAHDWWDELAERAKTDPALRVEMNRMAHQNPYATGPVQNVVTGEWAGGSGPTGSTPGTAQGYNALTGFNYTIPDFPVPPTYTQEGIVERKRAFLPPGPRDVLAGRQPAPLEFGFQMPTPGLMGSLTPNEREAFGSQLASEYNTSLGEVESGIRQRFGQTRRAPRARRARY